tara:strand:+ start:14829 stop:15419 length:591 start_codon:yes stop_codon:yes gene_type:complete
MAEFTSFLNKTRFALQAFAEDVKDRARKNLINPKNNRGKKGVKGKLYNAIDYKLSDNGMKVSFPFWKDLKYAKYVEYGVKGVGFEQESKVRNRKEEKSLRGYSFSKGKKSLPINIFDKWVITRKLAPRDAQGKFISRRSLKFALAKNVYRRGIRAKQYMEPTFRSAFKKLPPQLEDAFAKDVDAFLAYVLEPYKKD